MWIVRLALRRPYTFVVMSVLIVIMGLIAFVRTPKDIFPDIDIPVISVMISRRRCKTPGSVGRSLSIGLVKMLP